MTGFAIFIYFFSSFTSNKKTWTHPRLKFLQFLSPTIINIFFQLAKITFKSFVINYILREKVQYIISQKIFGIDSTTVRRYVSAYSILFDKCTISVSQRKTFINISRSLEYIYIYIRNYNYVKAWAERDLGGGMHRLADVSVRSRPLDRIARGNSDVLVTGRRWPSLSDGRRGGTRPGTKSVGTRSYRIEVTAPRQ